ncbi:MAG: Sua5/YciO/YrdC/YwlC family protein [Thiogranum sp.]
MSFKARMASRWIKAGGVIAYPTEAVFGLGCDPSDPLAVTRLLAIKKRPPDKGLILVAADWAQLQPWLQPQPADLQRRMLRTWPGPVTWLVPAADACPSWLTGAHSTLAVRVSAHPVVRDLCQRVGSAVVSTSANISARRPARSVLEVQLRFAASIDFILPGPLGGEGRPTTIRDLLSGRIVRS